MAFWKLELPLGGSTYVFGGPQGEERSPPFLPARQQNKTTILLVATPCAQQWWFGSDGNV
jgi:hypothetical protein